jgi:hypothetical protein
LDFGFAKVYVTPYSGLITALVHREVRAKCLYYKPIK